MSLQKKLKRSNQQPKNPKWSNNLIKTERTEQPNGKRSEWEQEMAKERVLKEYEPSVSGVTCQTFRRKDSNSLPEQLIKERKENELPPQGVVRGAFLGGRQKKLKLGFFRQKQSVRKEGR